MVMKAKNPIDQKWYYFVDKCMPFGSSISCALFQKFSNAISHVMTYKTNKENVNYLDDFLFIAFLKWLCDEQVKVFLDICSKIQFPVALEKTCWSSTLIVFLGMLIDTVNQRILIPVEKLRKALNQIDRILENSKRKATVIQIQKLCGILNFLCRAIMPRRPFLMRLYQSLAGIKSKNEKLKPYHHIRVAEDTILDLQVWKAFLTSPESYARPFLDVNVCDNAVTLDWYTDAAKAVGKGFGRHHRDEWFYAIWEEPLLKKDPSIGFLELYAVTVSILLWVKYYKNQRIVLFCDNESVVHMVNNQSSKCKNCMTLIRILVIECILHNVRVYAKHVRTEKNSRADSLSRGKIDLFKKLSADLGVKILEYQTPTPRIVKDISDFWME